MEYNLHWSSGNMGAAAVDTTDYKNRSSSSAGHNMADYAAFCDYLEDACGITLGENKAYLITSRLKSIMGEYGIGTLAEAVHKIKNENNRRLKIQIIDAMTTNETSWFRDIYPYEYLQDILLPALSGPRMTTPRIWSAACSYGHEPYSISIVVQEYLEKNPGNMPGGLQILGTDISTRALKQAEDAEYDILGLSRGLSDERKKKYFIRTSDGMVVCDRVRLRVSFQALNLLQSFSGLGKFDVIFCRNVLIYFSNKNKTHILDRMAECLFPGGHLFLGASEPITNYSKRFEQVSWPRGVIYRLAG